MYAKVVSLLFQKICEEIFENQVRGHDSVKYEEKTTNCQNLKPTF